MNLSRFQKRIARDMDLIRGHYSSIYTESTWSYFLVEYGHWLKIRIPKNYPFKCIELYVINKENGEEQSYVELYKKWIGYYYNHLHELPKPSYCLCCDTITRQWSPHNRMINVIKELGQFHEWWKELRCLHYAKKMLIVENDLNKYLNNDSIKYILSFLHVRIS
jgi:hypothetical protein